MRFERDYLITDAGFEILSQHRIGLEARAASERGAKAERQRTEDRATED
jgi:hypothetical protein